MFPFYCPRKHQKTKDFLLFSGGLKSEHCLEMGQKLFLKLFLRVLKKMHAKSFKHSGKTSTQKVKFSIMDFFSKCDQIRSMKSLMDKFIFCAVNFFDKGVLSKFCLWY